jgi:cytochrome d ubiquinol oxidase subunit II
VSNEIILAAALIGSFVFYLVSGGADFGAGILDLTAAGSSSREQRELIAEAIAPIWEANHVWLILDLVLLFTVFPDAFYVLVTALHVPLLALLLGIVFRGSTFVFRKYDTQREHVFAGWSLAFGLSSLFTPFVLGICLGGLMSGEIHTSAGRVVTGFFAGWTTPFAILTGGTLTAFCAFLAAIYLTLESHEDHLRDVFRVRGLWFGAVLIVLGAALVLWRFSITGIDIFEPSGLLAAFPGALVAAALLLLYYRAYRLARAAAAVSAASTALYFAWLQFPLFVIPDVSLIGAGGAPRTLSLLIPTLLVGAVTLFPSFLYLFWVFKFRKPGES